MPRSKFKLVFVGDSSVGKTSIISRFMYNHFDVDHDATIGIDFLAKTHTVDDKTVRLQLWDTAGQERFRSLIPSYIRDSSVAVVVYAINNRDTFRSVDKWIEEVRTERDKDVLIILVGNKHDLEERDVSKQEGKEKAEDFNARFIETSAKTGHNVEEMFNMIARELPEQDSSKSAQRHGTVEMRRPNRSVEGGCCKI